MVPEQTSISAPTAELTLRSRRLFGYFASVLSGKRAIVDPSDAKLFLEALIDQPDRSTCVEKLIASLTGLEAFRKSLRLDTSPPFLNGTSIEVIRYLSDPILKHLCSGQFLQQIVTIIVEPPTFWNNLLEAYSKNLLAKDKVAPFAWLLLELLSTPSTQTATFQQQGQDITSSRSLLNSPLLEVRTLGQKIKHVLDATSSNTTLENGCGPGGRHDNDHVNFRHISILPTPDELFCKEVPFYRREDSVMETKRDDRLRSYLDNHFRLLREDMFAELRTDFQIAMLKKSGKRIGTTIQALTLAGVNCGIRDKRKPCGLTLYCSKGLPQLSNLIPSKRKAYLQDHRNFLKHQSLGYLVDGNEPIALGFIDRDEQLLVQDPPVIVFQITNQAEHTRALLAAKQSSSLRLLQVDTPIFAYEPVLKRLQCMLELPFESELLFLDELQHPRESSIDLSAIVQDIKDAAGRDISSLLGVPNAVLLDVSQLDSLLAAMRQKVSLIQGPPGTGKSFIGALLVKVLHCHTSEVILVICYTNHALDQFLEELLKTGIPKEDIVRLGSKSTNRTEVLSLFNQRRVYTRGQTECDVINKLKEEASKLEEELKERFSSFRNLHIGKNEILDYLEFEDTRFYEAFKIPDDIDGTTRVGKKGKGVRRDYLLDLWVRGKDANIFRNTVQKSNSAVWDMPISMRHESITIWTKALLQEHTEDICEIVKTYNHCQRRLSRLLKEGKTAIIKSKRIIGCTTTAAAQYTSDLQAAAPGVILVEEAGEILESHILGAIGPASKHLILIGDHKQLRPKVNNYTLTVEKGNGYNLNQSLFERLVRSGFPHSTLQEQHRMCPEISSFVRNLTYPDLRDGKRTLNRPGLRGFQHKVVFMNHSQHELEFKAADPRDPTTKSSKQNPFEAEMILKCVRYLGQQGYRTDDIAVLTPYLGQLNLIRTMLKADHDPVLNDLDSYDLVKAGLMTAASASILKRPINLSTIDNYQGEESNIIVASLTRSNKDNDIGFMSSPQRLNVLMSRARDALIIIGDSETYMSARKGKELYTSFFKQLKDANAIHDGFPVKCERHPGKKALLCRPQDFDNECPDGGCTEPCGTILNCGLHECPSKCHQLSDHSKINCLQVMHYQCPKNHKVQWKCWKTRPNSCKSCEAEAVALQKKQQRDHELEVERAARQNEYAKELAEIQAKISAERKRRKDEADEKERQAVLQQHRKQLQDLTMAVKKIIPKAFNLFPGDLAIDPPAAEPCKNEDKAKTEERAKAVRGNNATTSTEHPPGFEPLNSAAKDDWENQKKFEGAMNEALDSLMGMVGLEEIKKEFLEVKAKVDTVVRQGASLKDERFGAALLGNPGTGKTTVARLYAKFLTSMGVLPGDYFVETTGSRLANDGIAGCKKHIEDIQNNGGGAFFVDEAYQLASGNHYSGAQVLDFLLAEIENLTGKVVFILAGYNKQMEAFFAHNPGIPSRIPIQLQFDDYTNAELLQIINHRIESKYQGSMKLDGGLNGLFSRIVARRIGRGRGRDGFGNAREVHNVVSKIASRQAKRLARERKAGTTPDDFLFTKEDLIGIEPAAALTKNAAFIKLQNMIGLKAVKDSVKVLIDRIQVNYQRELDEKPLIDCSLNKVFLGSPGTGKTSVAKLYGQILVDIGLLSNGEVVIKNPADFVGSALGQSETNTKAILANTIGKVLIIDEAYMLAGGLGASGGQSDPYKTAVVDTIVAEVQSTAGEDRCVLLLGYKDQMEEMFQKVNPGLTRRFPLDSAFVFEDFTDEELAKILELKLQQGGFKASDQAKKVALDVLGLARNRPHFGNAGEVDILLDKAKTKHQERLSAGQAKDADVFEAKDFDEDFDRGARAATNCRLLFKDAVGCEAIIALLEGYQKIAESMKQRGLDPREQIPFSFLFRGPPGTGKTTTARRMGKVFYDMGFLAGADVIECSATELVGEYVGQTGPKTQKLFEKALGKVLFIDEAYRLAEGAYAKEAMDEIVDCLTKPKFAQKLVVILAGYDDDINRLMSINQGLTSRFPETIIFDNMASDQCLLLLSRLLEKKNVDTNIINDPSAAARSKALEAFTNLSQLPSWANARDVQQLSKDIYGTILKSAADVGSSLILTEAILTQAFERMTAERARRGNISRAAPQQSSMPHPQRTKILTAKPPPEVRTEISTWSNSAVKETPKTQPAPEEQPGESSHTEVVRDPGVSHEAWRALQEAKLAAQAQKKEQLRVIAEEKALQDRITRLTAEHKQQELKQADDDERAKRKAMEDELKRLHEAARIKAVLATRAKLAMEQEQKTQQKLRRMGVCPAGYQWIKKPDGYCCSAGGHFVSNAKLGL